MEYLQGDGDYADRDRHPLPQVIFLDAHLPQISGAHVLEFIKSRAELAPTPVIILTGAISPVASLKLYRLGANAVCLKPLSPAQMHEFVSAMCKFWVESVLPPSES